MLDLIAGDRIRLNLIEKCPGDGKSLPFYYYDICKKVEGEQLGKISIRIGHNYHSYYNGHIGYEVNEGAQGQGFPRRIIAGITRAWACKGSINWSWLINLCPEGNVTVKWPPAPGPLFLAVPRSGERGLIRPTRAKSSTIY